MIYILILNNILVKQRNSAYDKFGVDFLRENVNYDVEDTYK